jgi:nucleoside-diphosphate-sugar epimerase
MKLSQSDKIVLFGGAGLVGQNLVVLLKQQGYSNLVVIDKHKANSEILQNLHPELTVVQADMAETGTWENLLKGSRACVMLQAQIGGELKEAFERNNITSTQIALEACQHHEVPYIVHISSSVVHSMACDLYTESKKAQEKLVVDSSIRHCVLRPTLMFGWFDRKHLGWLSRFMKRIPVFPIPGSRRYMRQPLYVMDFCRIILSCLEDERDGSYNITGKDCVDYIDIISEIKNAISAKTVIIKIPCTVFSFLLKIYSLFDRDPPFTTKQLKALVTPDEFELIPWWNIFNVPATPFKTAIKETFIVGQYSNITLEF